MQKHLKEVQEIFPDSRIIQFDEDSDETIMIDTGNHYMSYFYLEKEIEIFRIYVHNRLICVSLDFSKILDVLRALKNCEVK
jgi:hypothetical protein